MLMVKVDLKRVIYVDLKGSMSNGGGPGCLRLRMVIPDPQLSGIHKGVILTDSLYKELLSWVSYYYRDELHIEDLKDPSLFNEIKLALLDLASLLKLEGFYRKFI
jgi:succinylarginine dihydrolase